MTHPNPSTALASVLVDELIRSRVTRFVVAPGSRSTALAIAAATHPDAEVTVCIDERSAGFTALGMGKAGAPSAVIVTSGTAVANLLPSVVEAEMSQVPLVVLTADRPPELRDVGANQTIDQAGIFGRHVRWHTEVGVAEDVAASNDLWRSTACRAVAEATGPVGGPVHMNVAFREPLVPLSDDGRVQATPFTSPTSGREGAQPWTEVLAGGPPESVLPAEVAGRERGIVVVGAGTFDIDRADRLAARLGWPLVVEPTAGGRPLQAISTAHLLAGHQGFVDSHTPEVALVIGRTGLSRPLGRMLANVPTVVSDGGRWTDPGRRATMLLAGHPVVDSAKLEARSGGWRRSWFEAERVARQALDAALDGLDEPSELRVARDTAATAQVLVTASSMPIRDLDITMRPGGPEVIANRGASGIDGFVSTVLGVAAVRGSATALAGDLSMLHDQNGFLTDGRPDAVFVVVDNNGGGIFSFLPQASLPSHLDRLFATPHGRSFERYADFHGLEYHPVTDPAGLAPTIVAASSSGGIHLVVVLTDRRRNVDQHREVTAAVHSAISDHLGGA